MNQLLRKLKSFRLIKLLYLVIVLLLLSSCNSKTAVKAFQTIEDLNHPDITIGGVTGSVHEPYIGKMFPLAQEKQFNTINEMLVALDSGQIDAFVAAEASILSTMEEKPGKIKMLGESFAKTEVGMVISPNTQYKNLKEELNEFLKEMDKTGELNNLYHRWFILRNQVMPEVMIPENPVGTLKVGTSGELVPISYYENGQLVGFDIELTLRFAYAYNYLVEFKAEGIASRLIDAEFGTVDLLSGGIAKTKERAEKVIFADTPVYYDAIAVAIKDTSSKDSTGFIGWILSSLEKTLIREDRYKMILSGLGVTAQLSIGTLLLGSLLGFVFCMLRRSKNKIISKCMSAFISLIDGVPVILVLLICFYVIFSKIGMKEIPVAIIAFSIAFGSRVAIVLDTGLNGIAPGEIEAAEAMGMTPVQIFRKIQFPQAVNLTFDMYKAQVVAMIKNTSIVGYIAVQDLTKVSDIIRARTYESFFSLVFTAVIYFFITRLAIILLSVLGNAINHRRKEK